MPENPNPDEQPANENPAPTPPPEGGQQSEGGDEVPADVLRKELTDARAEAANYRVKLREAKDQLDKAKSPEEIEAAVRDYQARIDSLEREVSVSKVARKYNLPDVLAARLNGSTDEELEADAQALAALLPKPEAPPAPEPERLGGGLNPSDADDPYANLSPAELGRLARGVRR